MKAEQVDINKLSPDPANVRSHSNRNLSSIKSSLQRFGQQKPIVVDKKWVVVAGNGTLEAARDLGWETISVVRTELEGPEAIAFAIADNRTEELASWDFPALGDQVRALIDAQIPLECMGWQEHEINPLLEAVWTPPELEPLSTGDEGEEGTTPDSTSIVVTSAELEVIERAVGNLNDQDSNSLSLGEGLKRICEEWLL